MTLSNWKAGLKSFCGPLEHLQAKDSIQQVLNEANLPQIICVNEAFLQVASYECYKIIILDLNLSLVNGDSLFEEAIGYSPKSVEL